MNRYPSPCGKCPAEAKYMGRCPQYRKCNQWRMWFLWHWKQFNLYAKKHGIEPTTPPQVEETEEEKTYD